MAIISEYIGLRAKSYVNRIYKPDKDEYTEEKIAKGVPEAYDEKKIGKGVPGKHLKKRIKFEDYKKCLFNERIIRLGYETEAENQRERIYSFRSAGFTQFSVETQKICLSSNDDKRYTLKTKPTTTLALGHHLINKM